jgi:hypothetical protein
MSIKCVDFDLSCLEVVIPISQLWFTSICCIRHHVCIIWTNIATRVCIWIVRHINIMTTKCWSVWWITVNSISMVLNNGVFGEVVDWEEEWVVILFVGVTIIPADGSVSAEDVACSRLYHCQRWPLVVAHLVELGCCEWVHWCLVDSFNFTLIISEKFGNESSVLLIFKNSWIVKYSFRYRLKLFNYKFYFLQFFFVLLHLIA